jgi:hypothetical protein
VPAPASGQAERAPERPPGPGRLSWATLLRRVFVIETSSVHSGGARRILGAVTESHAASERELASLRHSGRRDKAKKAAPEGAACDGPYESLRWYRLRTIARPARPIPNIANEAGSGTAETSLCRT